MVVKINVSVPEDILEQIDSASEDAHTSRSAFLVLAAKRYIEDQQAAISLKRRKKAADRIDRFRKKFGNWDATAEVLKWRQLH